MKSLILTAGVATLAIGTPATAQKAGAAAPQSVTRAQFSTRLDSTFKSLDTNNDGSLSAAEMAVGQKRELEAIQATLRSRVQTAFQQLDTNKDGKLSLQEFAAQAPQVNANESSGQVLSKMDSNKDGKLSPDEFKAPRLAQFTRADTNKDGSLTAAEMQAASRK